MFKPRILIVSGLYPSVYKPYEGTFVHRWAKQLVKCGCDVDIYRVKAVTFGTYIRSLRDIVDFYRTPKSFHYRWHDIDVHGRCVHLVSPGSKLSTRTESPVFYRAVRPDLVSLFQKRNYDILYFATGSSFIHAVSRYASENNIPYLASAIGGNVNACWRNPKSFRFKMERHIFLKSELVICVSEDMRRKVLQMTNNQAKTMTFYSGVETDTMRKDIFLREQYRSKLSFAPHEITILFVGHMQRTKGVYELLRVFAKLVGDFPFLRLLLVGPIIEKTRIKMFIKNRSIESQVVLTGGVDHKDIPGYLNAGDIFSFPSWSEGLPNAVMEACSCELPVIASDAGGNSELIDHGDSGILVPPRDKEKLYEETKKLIESPDLRAFLGKTARKKILKDFNYKKNGRYLIGKISSIVASKNRKSLQEYVSFK